MKIHKEIYGKGEPIILLHGWAMHTGVWREFAQALANNYQIICLDLPSHGRSDVLPEFTLALISEQLINAFPKQACTVLGWSLGVTIALDLTQRFPNRINRLALLAGNPCFVKNADWPGMELSVLHRFATHLIADCHGTLLRFAALQILGSANYKQLVNRFKVALQETNFPQQSVLEQGLTLLATTDLRAVLADLHCPVILMLGDRDTLVPVTLGQKMLELQPNLQLHIFKKAGHIPFLSHQQDLLALLTTFMEDNRVY
jgi:pimeloyl-[acyl-carrier protein] methyl ester esterase